MSPRPRTPPAHPATVAKGWATPPAPSSGAPWTPLVFQVCWGARGAWVWLGPLWVEFPLEALSAGHLRELHTRAISYKAERVRAWGRVGLAANPTRDR